MAIGAVVVGDEAVREVARRTDQEAGVSSLVDDVPAGAGHADDCGLIAHTVIQTVVHEIRVVRELAGGHVRRSGAADLHRRHLVRLHACGTAVAAFSLRAEVLQVVLLSGVGE
ncbi:MAG: hypothetical protein GY938_03040 [Ketobacter sp.]|nr:hypothetical protein [Ketobacter sp.]